uniref:Uncharacterized protein n=1 Tax=Arundo donax TaxID=35708 RepID=A0A0A9BBB2_ARUDO
MVWISIRF